MIQSFTVFPCSCLPWMLKVQTTLWHTSDNFFQREAVYLEMKTHFPISGLLFHIKPGTERFPCFLWSDSDCLVSMLQQFWYHSTKWPTELSIRTLFSVYLNINPRCLRKLTIRQHKFHKPAEYHHTGYICYTEKRGESLQFFFNINGKLLLCDLDTMKCKSCLSWVERICCSSDPAPIP